MHIYNFRLPKVSIFKRNKGIKGPVYQVWDEGHIEWTGGLPDFGGKQAGEAPRGAPGVNSA